MIAIIDYQAGNTTSVVNAIKSLGAACIVTDDPKVIKTANKVILPGVGSAGPAMESLKTKGLDQVIKLLETPFLGICLGLQLMCEFSEEDNTPCLGIFDSKVKKFPPKEKVPHMGWNSHTMVKGELFKDIDHAEDFYFVHSYYVEQNKSEIATGDYIVDFASAINKNNFYGVQFHPEKSANPGMKLLQNFLKLQ
ncbi:imidazole glycerol phosphate synthase subunit HisH [Parvicella tangerina]|uniref:Imidazole glycerol phosphate synthase subunit HisH n=1 Tax=Parvicella tangerina TaxID=2829795 RepID=A0A916JMP1_9FLAO|nr:imidazole glycerol phosphate synthase subunit HisH [Parvicella tangerina]CAG5081334.1 Imidazole glycerol phosphate synthase subunit HisH [Parvicella tangerina]